MSKQVRETPVEEGNTFVGKSLRRSDAPSKVQGNAMYATDVSPGDMLHAKLVKSQVAHAEIVSVDVSAAEALDGVAAVATYKDVPDTRRGQGVKDQPILAHDRVRYIGEPIAVVAAETEEIAEIAVSLVDIEYDELEAVYDVEEAFSRDPPATLHPNVREYEFVESEDEVGHLTDEDADRLNVVYRDSEHIGAVEMGFEEADSVIEAEYEIKPFQHCAMEPHVAVAKDGYDGIMIWTSQQVPHVIEREICRTYPDIEPRNLTIKTPYIGGGFGGKASAFLESRLLAVARQTTRPVRLQFTRSEEFTTGVNRPGAKIKVKDGVTDDGDLLARDVDVKFDTGAYNEYIYRLTRFSPIAVYASYDIPNVKWDCYEVYTNHPTAGAFRGFGKPQIYWAIERHMDRVASEIGMDPFVYREQNLLREGETNARGDTLGPNDIEGCLSRPAKRVRDVNVAERYPEYADEEWMIGRGFAYGIKPVPRSVSSVTVNIEKGMNVKVRVGAPDIGQGSETALIQMTAEELNIDPASVRVVAGDTDQTSYDRGPTGSRFTYHAGNALLKAIIDAKEKMFDLAAAYFDSSVELEDLAIDGERIHVRQDRDEAIHINELFTEYDHPGSVSRTTLKDGGELIGTATYDSQVSHPCWTPVGQAAIVAVNRVTGKIAPIWFNTTCDVGCAINPKNVEQQLEGAAAQGIASALYEEIIYDGGRTVNPNFKDYRIPGSTELPIDSETTYLESQSEEGPYGAKGIGEAGMMASAPAIGNAVKNAVGFEFNTIPINPERVLETLISVEK